MGLILEPSNLSREAIATVLDKRGPLLKSGTMIPRSLLKKYRKTAPSRSRLGK
jgi:hypothetical protein